VTLCPGAGLLLLLPPLPRLPQNAAAGASHSCIKMRAVEGGAYMNITQSYNGILVSERRVRLMYARGESNAAAAAAAAAAA